MNSKEDSLFEKAMTDYKSGLPIDQILKDFEYITTSNPSSAAGWTCLSWLQLLAGENNEALRSARYAVKLNGQDPQARINLSLALLETNAKGVRENVEFVKRALMIIPDLEEELKESIEDGLLRKPNWKALIKMKNWLEL